MIRFPLFRSWLAAALVASTLGVAVAPPAPALAPTVAESELVPTADQRRATRLITHFITNYHYRKRALDDALSEQIFERYMEALDPGRSFFLQHDIDELGVHRDRIDDYLRKARLEPAFAIFKRYRHRVIERVAYAKRLLEGSFDFGIDEQYRFDRSDAPWPASEAELNELWRKRIKNEFLSLRLAGKSDDEVRKRLQHRYDDMLRRTLQLNGDDVFQTFINAYAQSIEPHTAYFSPRTSENFRIRMSLSLEGIGAVLQSEDEFTVVREVVKGGPAADSGELKPGDRITGVGQGADGPIVDVVGWRLDDVVDLIRGPKGSVVRLEVQSAKDALPDAPPRIIALTRNRIELEEQAAKSDLIEVTDANGRPVRVGVIEVPAFYLDFEARARGEPNYRSTTRDVRRLLGELKARGIDGVIVDLRGNGGGSLIEATELTGLFIDQGPIVQVRNSEGRIDIERDTDPGVAYDGPLVVLVDRYSASASEIFAGAIQDYGRGVIVGEPTFGKGTVQNLVDLSRFTSLTGHDLGQLKTTVAQFFRVAGASTQNRGVVPDIVFPTAISATDVGERALDNALPWDTVQPARFVRVARAESAIARARERFAERAGSDPALRALAAQARALAEASERHSVTLLESRRRAEQERMRREARERSNRLRAALGLEPLSDADGADDGSGGEAEPEMPDVLLREAGRILADLLPAPPVHRAGTSGTELAATSPGCEPPACAPPAAALH